MSVVHFCTLTQIAMEHSNYYIVFAHMHKDTPPNMANRGVLECLRQDISPKFRKFL